MPRAPDPRNACAPRRVNGTPLDEHLTWRLHRLNKLSDKRSSEAYAREFGLPVGEARCLAAMGESDPLSVNDLAARAHLNKAQASRAALGVPSRSPRRRRSGVNRHTSSRPLGTGWSARS